LDIDRRAGRPYGVTTMRPFPIALVLLVSLAPSAGAGDAVVVLQETRAREPGKKIVRHVAKLQNTSPRAIERLRVTVELYDYFDTLLWAQTVNPMPASLRPGDTATLSLTTPHLEAHRKTAYRFDYRSR